jgi:pilus assembly protein CpaC
MKLGRFVLVALAAVLSLAGIGPLETPAHAQPRVDRTEEINLAVGENKTIPALDVKNYSEGTPGIVEVKVTTDGTQFVIAGQKAGTTTLLTIHKSGGHTNYVINVFARPPDVVEQELKKLLDGTIGLRLRRVGSRFFIEGGVSTEADQKRVERLASLYPGQVESLVELGSVAFDRQFNIRIDFYYVQVSRETGYAVGLSWPGSIGGEGIVGNEFTYDFISKTTTTAVARVTNQPLPSLDIASRRGWAKVLKQATVITGNGSEAKFLSGGEQNFQLSTNFTINIQKIEFGVNMSVLPRFDRATGEMEVKISADVNDLTPPVANTLLPGRDTSKLTTLVHLKLGQSVILSGISTRSQRHNVRGLPLLSDIPILGLLFGSHQDSQADVEGMVVIIPSVIDSLPRASLDGIRDAMNQYENFSGNTRKVRLYEKTPPVVGGAR